MSLFQKFEQGDHISRVRMGISVMVVEVSKMERTPFTGERTISHNEIKYVILIRTG